MIISHPLRSLLYLFILLSTKEFALAAASDDGPFWNSTKFDTGYYGAYPNRDYGSFNAITPRLNILQWDPQCEHGITLLTPGGDSVPDHGPLLLDGRGNLIWAGTRWKDAENLKIQRYRGRDYLTFWFGVHDDTYGRGHYYMLDSSYEIRHVVQAAGENEGDLHEFTVTPEGTALLAIYEIRTWNLRKMGVMRDEGYIVDSLFQEVDIETGDLLFEWRATDHFPVSESLAPIGDSGWGRNRPWDYFHINSISKDPDGNYWVSSRYMCAVFCVSRVDGSVLFRLGGRDNDFKDLSGGAATNFTWQHHMTWHTASSDQLSPETEDFITIFDNGAYNWHPTNATASRALKIRLDMSAKLKPTAELLATFSNPLPVLAHSQGSVQVLPPLSSFKNPQHGHHPALHHDSDEADTTSFTDETVFVGWGHSGGYSQFDMPTGRVLCDVHYAAYATFDFGWAHSYRVFKHLGPWVGKPLTRPAIGTRRPHEEDAISTVYASWNGATEVRAWKLQGAGRFPGGEDDPEERGWTDIAVLPKEGFEVAFELADYGPEGHDGDGHALRKRHGGAGNGPGYTYYRVLALDSYDEQESKSIHSRAKGKAKGKGNGKGKGHGKGKGKGNGKAKPKPRPPKVLGVSLTLNQHTGSVLGDLSSTSFAHSASSKGIVTEARLREQDTVGFVLVFIAATGAGFGILGWEVVLWKRRRRG